MRSGDVLIVDFGLPKGSTPALVRPAVVVTAQATLDEFSQTFHVVPVTSTLRRWPSEVTVERGQAQCHLVAPVDAIQVEEHTGENVGPVAFAQIRDVVAILLGL